MSSLDKPLVVEKIHRYLRAYRKNGHKVGKLPRSMVINYNNLCNFRCEFCCSTEASNDHIRACLDDETIRDVANQAHELGIWEMVLQGGELLVNLKSLLNLMKNIGTERFHTVLITNGYFLSKDMAKILADSGLDCVEVSISTMNAEEHNRSRGNIPDAHERALQALDIAAEAGMNAIANVIFGHHNSKSDDLFQLLNYLKAKKYNTYLIMAMPFGVWKDNKMDAEDFRILNKIRQDYDCCFDTWDMYDPHKTRISGCWAVNRSYLTPTGDILACTFMHIKLGNVKEQPLKDILDYGFRIKYFGDFSPVCLSAHNSEFRKRFLPENGTIFAPRDAHEIFEDADYERIPPAKPMSSILKSAPIQWTDLQGPDSCGGGGVTSNSVCLIALIFATSEDALEEVA